MAILSAFPGGGNDDVLKACIKQLDVDFVISESDKTDRYAAVGLEAPDGAQFISYHEWDYDAPAGLWQKKKLSLEKKLDNGKYYAYGYQVKDGLLFSGESGNNNVYFYSTVNKQITAIECGSYISPRIYNLLPDGDNGGWVKIRNINPRNTEDINYELGYISYSTLQYTKLIDGNSDADVDWEFVVGNGAVALGPYQRRLYYASKSTWRVAKFYDSTMGDFAKLITRIGDRCYISYNDSSSRFEASVVLNETSAQFTALDYVLYQNLFEIEGEHWVACRSELCSISGSTYNIQREISYGSFDEYVYSEPYRVITTPTSYVLIPTRSASVYKIDMSTGAVSTLSSITSDDRMEVWQVSNGYAFKAQEAASPLYYYDNASETVKTIGARTNLYTFMPLGYQNIVCASYKETVFAYNVDSGQEVASINLYASTSPEYSISGMARVKSGQTIAVSKRGVYVIDLDYKAYCLDYTDYWRFDVDIYTNDKFVVIDGDIQYNDASDVSQYTLLIDLVNWERVSADMWSNSIGDYARKYMVRVT